MSTKQTLKFTVINGYDPIKEKIVDRPVIVDRERCDIDQLVEHARKKGYMRGQHEDLKAFTRAFFETIVDIIQSGKEVEIDNWLRFRPELTGSVGKDRQMTKENDLRVVISPLSGFEMKMKDYKWKNVEEKSLIPKIYSINCCGDKAWEIKRSEDIIVSGKNFAFNFEEGDSVTASWGEGENAHTVSLVPRKKGCANMIFSWTDDLNTASEGTVVTFVFKTTSGVEGGKVWTITREVTVA